MKPAWIRAAEYSGISPNDQQIEQMDRYARWLASEGREAGGIGPAETQRIDRRHLGDSLLFASQIPRDLSTIWDLGSGAGLPGIPLAICLPTSDFVLIDRSGRRCDLMRRALRILDLPNCQVQQADIAHLEGTTDAIVSRASLSPDELRSVIPSYLNPGGVAVVAGSWRVRPKFPGWTTVEIPEDALDQTIWLLIMRRQ
ncbi:MAG TPA: RsmG family class I SAM-dependent methyltransferase [Acidimicrobiia bacterium]